MAFQTSILRDGEWVTETVNLQAALKASATPKPSTVSQPNSPTCGILSRTVVESPIVRWILPVRLRAYTNNDIAFIGVSLCLATNTCESHDFIHRLSPTGQHSNHISQLNKTWLHVCCLAVPLSASPNSIKLTIPRAISSRSGSCKRLVSSTMY